MNRFFVMFCALAFATAANSVQAAQMQAISGSTVQHGSVVGYDTGATVQTALGKAVRRCQKQVRILTKSASERRVASGFCRDVTSSGNMRATLTAFGCNFFDGNQKSMTAVWAGASENKNKRNVVALLKKWGYKNIDCSTVAVFKGGRRVK